MTKTPKEKRQAVLDALETELLSSQNAWTDVCTTLYEDILTNPAFKPLEVDAVLSMMHRNGFPVPQASVDAVLQMAPPNLVTTQYQRVANYWSACIGNLSAQQLLYLRSKGVGAYRVPSAMNKLVLDGSPPAIDAVCEELKTIQDKTKYGKLVQYAVPEIVQSVLKTAVFSGQTRVLDALFPQPLTTLFVVETLLPPLQQMFHPTSSSQPTDPQHLYDSVFSLIPPPLRSQAVTHLCKQLDNLFMVCKYPSFGHLSALMTDRVQVHCALLNAMVPWLTTTDTDVIVAALKRRNCPPLPALEAKILAAAIGEAVDEGGNVAVRKRM